MGVETKRTKHRIEKSKDWNEQEDGWAQANLVEGRFQIKSACLGLLTNVKEATGTVGLGLYIHQPRENCALAHDESSISI